MQLECGREGGKVRTVEGTIGHSEMGVYLEEKSTTRVTQYEARYENTGVPIAKGFRFGLAFLGAARGACLFSPRPQTNCLSRDPCLSAIEGSTCPQHTFTVRGGMCNLP